MIKVFLFSAVLILVLSGCATQTKTSDPRTLADIKDACRILTDNFDWYMEMNRVSQVYGIPISIQMAFIKQESAFRHDARPYTYRNGNRVLASSAFGYSQALDGTWGDYLRETRNHGAHRSNFSASVDFMGWYNTKSIEQLNLSPFDTYNLYLAYHEGHTGFRNQSYKQKAWLMDVAKKVEKQAVTYSKQINYCPTIGVYF